MNIETPKPEPRTADEWVQEIFESKSLLHVYEYGSTVILKEIIEQIQAQATMDALHGAYIHLRGLAEDQEWQEDKTMLHYAAVQVKYSATAKPDHGNMKTMAK